MSRGCPVYSTLSYPLSSFFFLPTNDTDDSLAEWLCLTRNMNYISRKGRRLTQRHASLLLRVASGWLCECNARPSVSSVVSVDIFVNRKRTDDADFTRAVLPRKSAGSA